MGELDGWFRCNMLTLNLKNTKYVYFSGPRGQGEPPGVLTIVGERLGWAEGVRFLGLRRVIGVMGGVEGIVV